MNQLIGQGQIREGILIHIFAIIIVIGGKGFTQTMIVVEHTCDAIKTKPVQMVFIEPETAVG